MMERMKGMIAGFALIGVALWIKSFFSDVSVVGGGICAVFVLLIGPPILSYVDEKIGTKVVKDTEITT